MILKRSAKIPSTLAFPLLLALTLTLFFVPVASATIIVDNGPGQVGTGISLAYWVSDYGQFTTSQPYIITDVAVYMDADSLDAFQVSILSDNLGLPGAYLWSQSVNPATLGDAWHGVSGVTWTIPAGTYWAGFEVLSPPSNFQGTILFGSSPLDKFAYFTNGGWTVNENSPSSIALRIAGDPVSPAPIPGALPLLGSGLAILWAWRKRLSA